MAKLNYVFTSESVSEGHPDKVCDRISDAIVDLFLGADPYARVAVETLCTTNLIVLAGEVRGPASVTPDRLEAAARHAVRDIGYEQDGFHWEKAQVQVHVRAGAVVGHADLLAQPHHAAKARQTGLGPTGRHIGTFPVAVIELRLCAKAGIKIVLEVGAKVNFTEHVLGRCGRFLDAALQDLLTARNLIQHWNRLVNLFQDGIFNHLGIDHLLELELVERKHAHHLHQAWSQDLALCDLQA